MSEQEGRRLYLTEREALIVSLRWTMPDPASLGFVAAKLGLTRERVRMLESKVMSEVRRFAGRRYPTTLEEMGSAEWRKP